MPFAIRKKRTKIISNIEKIEGVYVCKEFRVWEMAKKKYVASLELLISSKSNRGKIQDEVSSILRAHKIKEMTV